MNLRNCEIAKLKIKDIPSCPGVYIFKNKQGLPIYIGKSTSLKDRINSYFIQSSKSIYTHFILYYVFIWQCCWRFRFRNHSSR